MKSDKEKYDEEAEDWLEKGASYGPEVLNQKHRKLIREYSSNTSPFWDGQKLLDPKTSISPDEGPQPIKGLFNPMTKEEAEEEFKKNLELIRGNLAAIGSGFSYQSAPKPIAPSQQSHEASREKE